MIWTERQRERERAKEDYYTLLLESLEKQIKPFSPSCHRPTYQLISSVTITVSAIFQGNQPVIPELLALKTEILCVTHMIIVVVVVFVSNDIPNGLTDVTVKKTPSNRMSKSGTLKGVELEILPFSPLPSPCFPSLFF